MHRREEWREREITGREGSQCNRQTERARERGWGNSCKKLEGSLSPSVFFLFVCVCACLFFFLSVCMYVCLSHSIFENMTIPVKKKNPKDPTVNSLHKDKYTQRRIFKYKYIPSIIQRPSFSA